MKGASPITSIDINDFEIFPVKELYKCKPRSYVQLPQCKSVVYFDHLDNGYAYCLSMLGDVIDLAAWQSVHPLIEKDILK